jgi:hypothetical protein
MASSGMLRRVALVRTDVSEELSASFIWVTRIGKLGTTLAVTSNRRTLLVFLRRHKQSVTAYDITSKSVCLNGYVINIAWSYFAIVYT